MSHARLEVRMESLAPFLQGSCIPYNMPVYPGAQCPIAYALADDLRPIRRRRWNIPSRHASGMEAARMRKKNKKPLRRKIALRLPDLDHAKSSVLNSLSSPSSRPNYKLGDGAVHYL